MLFFFLKLSIWKYMFSITCLQKGRGAGGGGGGGFFIALIYSCKEIF